MACSVLARSLGNNRRLREYKAIRENEENDQREEIMFMKKKFSRGYSVHTVHEVCGVLLKMGNICPW